MAALAALFAALAIAQIAMCCVTGSVSSLVVGLMEFAASLVAFCCWAWTL